MSEFELIGSIVKLRKFAPVVDLSWADTPGDQSGSNLIGSYIITNELAGHFEKVLESFTLQRHERRALREGAILDSLTHPRAHMLRGQYGTGKSYFLLMISALVEALGNDSLFEELYNKFRMFENIRYHMEELRRRGSRYLVVRIDGVKNIDMRFHELVQKSVLNRIEKLLGAHDFSESYKLAVGKLEDFKQDPVFSKLLQKVLDDRDISYDTLVEGLKASQRKNLKEYREVMEAVTRHKLDEGFDSLEAFMRSASEYVKDKGYSGIVVLIDEFSAYIKNSIEDRRITGDLAAIQSLAQLTVPRESQELFFICSMHVDFLSILGGAVESAEEIQKVRGRFTEMTLSFSNSENLVENILTVDGTAFGNLYEKHRNYFGALLNRFPDMSKVYPIHPHSVKSIIRVSSKFAQNDRTIFSFFAQAVNRKLGEPVVKEERLNLITAGDIYDYFIESISERNLLLRESAARCLSFCRNSLERDVVKALVIAQISAGDDSDARMSATEIAFILGVDYIQLIDMFLKDLNANPASNVIFYEKSNRFEFVAAGNAVSGLTARLDEEVQKIDGYEALLEALLDNMQTICIRKSYTVNPSRDTLPVRKELEGIIYRPADLVKSIGNVAAGTDKDGKLIFIVPGFADEMDNGLLQELKEKLVNAPSNICIAVPKYFPLHLERDLRLNIAAKALMKTGNLDENNKKILMKLHQPVEKNVENEIKKFGSIANFTFVFSGNTLIENFSGLDELYGFLLRRYYSKFPRVDAESIRGKSSIHTMVDSFLTLGGMTNIPEKYGSELERLIMDVMRPLDLVKVERSGSGFSARIKIPEESNNRNSFEIWQTVNETSKSIKDIFSYLEAAPFGLPDYIVEMYIAVAAASNQISIVYRGQVQQLNRMTIAMLGNQGYSLEKVRNSHPALKAEVKRVWLLFSKIHGRCGAKTFEPGLPQSDSAIYSVMVADMADVRVILQGFESRLENAGVKNPMLADLKKAIGELGSVSNPVDYMEAFVKLPAVVCNMENNSEALQRLDGFFSFLAGLNASLDGIWEMDTSLGGMRSLEGLEDNWRDLKSLYFEVQGMFDKLKKDIGENDFAPEVLVELKGRFVGLVALYNEEFIKLHKETSIRNAKLLDMMESRSVKLIEAFEKIKFKNIKRVSDIRADMHSIKVCRLNPVQKEDKLVNCSCTGYHEGLTELIGQMYIAKRMEESLARQISNIGNNHAARLLSMGYMPDTQNLQKDWESLKEYLNEGFDAISKHSADDVILLVEGLSQDMNSFMLRKEEEGKKQEADIKVKRTIGFRTLYTQIQSEISNMGYKSVSVEEFSQALQRIVEKTKKDFDEIDISG